MAPPPHLVPQLQGSLPHRPLHLVVSDEAVPLGGLSGGPATGHLECGEEPIHMFGVVLNQLCGVVKLGAVIDPHTAIQVTSDDVMVLGVLWEGER